MEIVDVVIVEAHQHCLEHIHSVLRRKKIFRPWKMLHFDAHPDLACPAIPAVACFTPGRNIDGKQNLYELLDARASGIAEWILPLTLATQLQTIEWIKPKFSKQFPCGRYSFQVGVHDPIWKENDKPSHFLDLGLGAQLKVDWNHPYYLEDNVVVGANDLALAQALTLHVAELTATNEDDELVLGLVMDTISQPWILDICLDYFACWNPYLSDIDAVDPELTDAFLEVMKQCTLFEDTNQRTMDPSVSKAYIENVCDFRNILGSVLTAKQRDDASTMESKLCRFYNSRSTCQRLLEVLVARIKHIGQPVLKLIIEAIPFWNMPHDVSSTEIKTIEKSILYVEKGLQRLLRNQSNLVPPPFLITIARSTCDGFAPAKVVEGIQEGVLAMLDRLFNADAKHDGKKCLRITKDYGDWEGSTLP